MLWCYWLDKEQDFAHNNTINKTENNNYFEVDNRWGNTLARVDKRSIFSSKAAEPDGTESPHQGGMCLIKIFVT